jgi:hypothetical protein
MIKGPLLNLEQLLGGIYRGDKSVGIGHSAYLQQGIRRVHNQNIGLIPPCSWRAALTVAEGATGDGGAATETAPTRVQDIYSIMDISRLQLRRHGG